MDRLKLIVAGVLVTVVVVTMAQWDVFGEFGATWGLADTLMAVALISIAWFIWKTFNRKKPSG